VEAGSVEPDEAAVLAVLAVLAVAGGGRGVCAKVAIDAEPSRPAIKTKRPRAAEKPSFKAILPQNGK
jgi:hypothetical protein